MTGTAMAVVLLLVIPTLLHATAVFFAGVLLECSNDLGRAWNPR